MDSPLTLIVPAAEHWRQFLRRPGSSGCSGLGDCDYCNKAMYPHRTGYLKSWITVYLKNKLAIDNGEVKMPRLIWFAADTANRFNVGEYHREYCDSNESICICQCDVASVLRAMFYHKDEDTIVSLDQIIPLFIKMKKALGSRPID